MILVVDDDAALVDLIRELLESHGYEVRTAGNGAEAFRHVRDPKCRAVLLDIQMPGINGPELLWLMASEGLHLPVLLMTANPDFDEREMKQFPNVKKLFHKPFYPEDLLAALRQYDPRPTPAAKTVGA